MYGLEYLHLLKNLENQGLFIKKESTSQLNILGYRNIFNSIRKSFRLIVDDLDEENPNDISYVYSGFAPLLVRLVQIATIQSVNNTTDQGSKSTKVGWGGFEDVLNLLPGPVFDIKQDMYNCNNYFYLLFIM